MRCPSCTSPNHTRYKAPEEAGDVTLRTHKCRRCGNKWLSVQMPLTGILKDLVEAEMSVLTSSEQQPTKKGSSGRSTA